MKILVEQSRYHRYTQPKYIEIVEDGRKKVVVEYSPDEVEGFTLIDAWGNPIELIETLFYRSWLKRAFLRYLEIWGYVDHETLLRGLNGADSLRQPIAGLLGAANIRTTKGIENERGYLERDAEGKWYITNQERFERYLKTLKLRPLTPEGIEKACHITKSPTKVNPDSEYLVPDGDDLHC